MILAIFFFTLAGHIALLAARFADAYKSFWFLVASVICAIDVILLAIVLIGYF